MLSAVATDDDQHCVRETRELNRRNISWSYGLLTGQFTLATALFTWAGLAAVGECDTSDPTSCTLVAGPGYWVRQQRILFIVVLSLSALLVAAAHTMSFL